jgi:hypothetical protein
MSKYIHTPGPWRIYDGGMIGSASVRRFPEMAVTEPGSIKGETIGVGMANARLIAAAPELLAACKGASKSLAGILASVAMTDYEIKVDDIRKIFRELQPAIDAATSPADSP